MKLQEFLAGLPNDWVLAPIYRKGAPMKSGRAATGKNPFEPSFEKPFNKHDAKLACEKNATLGAVGLFTGVRGNGFVILDIDKNLAVLQRKWGESLDGAPVVTSTRANAAKYIFRVPEALWGEVTGFGHSDEHSDGYEVLWGAQGLIYGDYPGSRDGQYKPGSYSWNGDADSVPVAPDWLLAEMKAAKRPTGFIKNKAVINLSDRTDDEVALIIVECLSVVEHRGAGQRKHWIRIGHAIHSVLPNDRGLQLWSDWSAKDPEFADEWEKGNPCAAPWSSFKPGEVNIGSLIWQANEADPKKTRYSEKSRQIIDAAEAAKVLEIRNARPDFEEMIKRGMKIYEDSNIARMNYSLHGLAMECNYKDQGDIEKLLIDHIQEQKRGKEMTLAELQQVQGQREYIIPGLLAKPYTILLYGTYGTGKSATAIGLMKHVCDGIPFKLAGTNVPVEKGKCVYFNADMSAMDFRTEADLHEIKQSENFVFVPDFNMYRRMEFIKTMNRHKPSLICIDSVSGCSGAKAADENKAEFASPIIWMNAVNGELWPACTIIFIHHANAHGGFRGSSAIGAAVGEVWKLEKPEADKGFSVDQRLITVPGKQRGGFGGTLLQTQEEDLTLTIQEIEPAEKDVTRAGSIMAKVLTRLRTSGRWMSRSDLNGDPLVGGSVSAIRKSLQRLVAKGVVEMYSVPGTSIFEYRAISSSLRGGILEVSQSHQTPSAGTPEEVGQLDSADVVVPPSEPSPGASLDPACDETQSPRATPLRTEQEINASISQSAWD